MVVELEIKVQYLPRMLAGMIAFPIVDAREVLEGYQEMLDKGFPDALGGALGVFRIPGHGLIVLMLATWSSVDVEERWIGSGRWRRRRLIRYPKVSLTYSFGRWMSPC